MQKSENDINLYFNLTQLSKINEGWTCDSNVCLICAKINSVIYLISMLSEGLDTDLNGLSNLTPSTIKTMSNHTTSAHYLVFNPISYNPKMPNITTSNTKKSNIKVSNTKASNPIKYNTISSTILYRLSIP